MVCSIDAGFIPATPTARALYGASALRSRRSQVCYVYVWFFYNLYSCTCMGWPRALKDKLLQFICHLDQTSVLVYRTRMWHIRRQGKIVIFSLLFFQYARTILCSAFFFCIANKLIHISNVTLAIQVQMASWRTYTYTVRNTIITNRMQSLRMT